jgi:hypothetical protein
MRERKRDNNFASMDAAMEFSKGGFSFGKTHPLSIVHLNRQTHLFIVHWALKKENFKNPPRSALDCPSKKEGVISSSHACSYCFK